MSFPLFEKHRATLDRALQAIAERSYWSAYPESPSPRNYGEGAIETGKAAFDALLGKPFELDQPGTVGRVGSERSPYGIALGITYPKVDVDALFAAIARAEEGWRKAGTGGMGGRRGRNPRAHQPAKRADGACRDAYDGPGIHDGVPGGRPARAGPRARGRGVRVGRDAPHSGQGLWEKPQGKGEPLRMEKRYRIVPRGVGLVIGVSTFPTWNGYTGFFADLATGNAVVVKPHPGAILPLAITVRIARDVLREAGFDPNVVTMVAHDHGDPVAQELALRPEVKLIDFTGSPANGVWLERHAHQAQVFTEKAGVNQVVLDSAADFKGAVRNIAFSLALYTGQMCTAPQNIYVPRGGIDTGEGHLSFEQVAQALGDGVRKLVGDPARAVEILGAVQSHAVLERIDSARALGPVIVDSETRDASPSFPRPRFARRSWCASTLPIATSTCTSGSGPLRSSSRRTPPSRASPSRARPCTATVR